MSNSSTRASAILSDERSSSSSSTCGDSSLAPTAPGDFTSNPIGTSTNRAEKENE
ncbi:unnamed protein product, partial [Amoebophrya sp. A25]|eukprot:GSA25T00026012001.1